MNPTAYKITLSALPHWTIHQPYSPRVTAIGGGSCTFAVTDGRLPTGLMLNSNGSFSGSPLASGSFKFTITATLDGAAVGSRAYSVTIAPPLTIATTVLPPFLIDWPYSAYLQPTGGTAPHTCALTAGRLPPGLGLYPAGIISGVCSVSESYSFTITVTDDSGASYSQTYTLKPVAVPNVLFLMSFRRPGL